MADTVHREVDEADEAVEAVAAVGDDGPDTEVPARIELVEFSESGSVPVRIMQPAPAPTREALASR
jgi:hypothetical protein